jgi:septal ring factor EnvC (AmiA/AmiB activator)
MISMRKIPRSFSVLLFLLVGTAVAANDIQNGAAQLRPQQERIQEIQKELKRKKAGEAAVIKREESILRALGRIERRLLVSKEELKRLDAKYDRIQGTIRSVEAKLDHIQDTIGQNQALSNARFVALYKTWRVGYVAYLLSYESYYDFARMVKFLKIVIDYDVNLLNQFRNQMLKKKRYQERLVREIKDLQRIRKEQEIRKSEIAGAKREKEALLHAVRKEKATYGRWIQELENQARELQLLVRKLEKETSPDKFSHLNFKHLKGKLSLPVAGNILFENRRRGIVIEASQHTPIKAIYPGKVIYSGWFEGYGNIIIIDHGDKYYTVSAHASKLLKRPNDRVEKGDIIALVGDTDSLRGPCLYFEIRYRGRPQDPCQWLSIPHDVQSPSGREKGTAATRRRGKS